MKDGLCWKVGLSCKPFVPGSDIENFMNFYRSNFPQASVTPKLHLLEDHVVEFLEQWRVGLGMLGEEGAESIHAAYNNLKRVYANVHNREDQLRLVTQEHHRRVCPLLQRRQAKKSAEE